ncbi:hypothetical protein K505DRAFT_94975 [Melanomma pulvis-pyrius CBS 109.77]|uniref:Uncharacterized protein n=1 Tax=Melanomma pulvis-pyrius CBS 109.77 TaxID=1314802 RepID=A0A6A6WZN9_9PLEO|nr:hypothetical protein K505DRAFT_94975 [Melanomma pulvis-pyrius CBS 109.77]
MYSDILPAFATWALSLSLLYIPYPLHILHIAIGKVFHGSLAPGRLNEETKSSQVVYFVRISSLPLRPLRTFTSQTPEQPGSE